MAYENPVLGKELKSKLRMRQPKPVLIAATALGLMLLAWAYYEAIGYLVTNSDRDTARMAYYIGLGIHAVLIWLIAPALASNAITQEREQQTWQMLIFTRLTPMQILLGKLVARLLPMAGLLALGLPYMLMCYVQSPLTPGVFFTTYFSFVVWIVFMASVSLFMSWAFRRTATAVAMSYLVLFVLSIGTALVNQVLSELGGSQSDNVTLWLNPVRIGIAAAEPAAGDNTAVLIFSTLTFAAVAAFLFWRMVARFRTFAVE